MIKIDGSIGEGGGQILRSALTLSTITGKPFTIENIRAHRPKPGLRAQHLRCVEAAGLISGANMQGNELNSIQLTFEPGQIKPGNYHFQIGTAGSTSLVLQTIFIPLSFASNSSEVIITGGTHVPWSPGYHYLDLQWLPFLKRLGYDAELKLVKAGFYPKGGGEIIANIHPARITSALQLLNRGKLKKIYGISAYANLDRQVAIRQLIKTQQLLKSHDFEPKIEIRKLSSPGINTMMLISGVFEHSLCCYFALGARGKPAEKVAAEAVQQFLDFIQTSGVIDEYLSDQLLIPLALIDKISEFRMPKITRHLLTNIDVIRYFIPAEITVNGKLGQEGSVRIVGVNYLK